jgi:hypothetical protein
MSAELNYPKRCSICHGSFEGWGNNAAPFPGRCCDDCNAEVIGIRETMANAVAWRRRSRKERAA